LSCPRDSVETVPCHRVGTAIYLAPEILRESLRQGIHVPKAPFSAKSDVWSMGLVMAEVVMGEHPVKV
jgi:serine/threonine protein kinase